LTEWNITTLKEHFETLLSARDHALEIQAREYERRLEDLNHAHQEAQRVLFTYVTRDVYEKDRENFQKLENLVNVELADRSGRSKGVITLFQILSGTAIVISVIVAIMNFRGWR
jgi:hypothetical protein